MAKIEKIEQTTEVSNEIDVNAILIRLQALEEENKAFKDSQKNIFKTAKEKYEWPRAYSYKTWGWIPVLWFTSFKKDTTKDLIYKNEKNAWVSNHYLKLSLADGSTASVEVTDFNNNFGKSEKIQCEVIWDIKNPTSFKFKDDTYGEFIVNRDSIN